MKRESRQSGIQKENLNTLEKETADIRKDFNTFCSYVIENQVKLSKKTGNIGKKDCFALNALFHVRENYEKPVYTQDQYPVISLFYYVAVKYKILEGDSKGLLLQKGRNYQYYCEASAWEQYALFLVICLYDGMFAKKESYWYPDSVAERWQRYIDSFMEGIAAQDFSAGRKIRWSWNSRIVYLNCLDFIAPYLEELNLIKVWRRPAPEENRGRSDHFWELELRPLAGTVFELYQSVEDDWDSDLDTVIQHAYMEYVDRLTQGEKTGELMELFGKKDGYNEKRIIDLEVSLRGTDCIRGIRMNLEDSLYDLHEMIQRAVDFDNDHLFEFMVGRGAMKRVYTLPEAMNSGRDLSVETSLGELDLRKGQVFTYLFDFGDMWQFDIKVLEIREGTIKRPEVIKSEGDAPEQYPYYEEEESWKAEISDRVSVRNILSQIEDDLIKEEHAALTGSRNACQKEPPDTLRREMERILLEKPDKMLMFITADMRKMLSELLKETWIDGSERCALAKLYSFGFCDFLEEDSHVISVPEAVKEVYAPKIKSGGKYDRIVETAEVFLRQCGVVEEDVLYASVREFLNRKISREDFGFLIYSRLHYFGMYYSNCFDGTEYMSCYDRELTQRILEERQKPENVAFTYPDLQQIHSGIQEEAQAAVREWKEYVDFDLSIDWQTAVSLIEQIPVMAASGVIKKEEILSAYREMLRGTGSRVTKKAERLIEKLCSSMPSAVKKGCSSLENDGLESVAMEESGSEQAVRQAAIKENKKEENAKEEKKKKGKMKKEAKDGYTQISIFDL